MPTVTCTNCEKVIERNQYEIDRAKIHFCSRKCKGDWQSKLKPQDHPRWLGDNLDVVCAFCGSKRRTTSAKIRRNKRCFCSQECRDKFRHEQSIGNNRVIIQCDVCKKFREISKVAYRKAKHHFCSFDCRSEWVSRNMSGENSSSWNGGWENHYGPNWKVQRRAARKRDGYTCQRCGITEQSNCKHLDVHHKVPFKTFGYIPGINDNYKEANKLTNLISVCNSCHKIIEPQSISFQLPLLSRHSIPIVAAVSKNCGCCGTNKPFSEFHRSKNSASGYHSYCKACRKETHV